MIGRLLQSRIQYPLLKCGQKIIEVEDNKFKILKERTFERRKKQSTKKIKEKYLR